MLIEKLSFLLIFSFILFVLLLGCSEETSGPSSSKSVIFPLSIGNYWAFIDSTFTDSVEVDSVKICISDEIQINYNNEDYYVFVAPKCDIYTNQPRAGAQTLYRNESDGSWVYGYINGPDTVVSPFLVAKYPVSVGDTYDSRKCIAKNHEITTPAGIFQCIGYLSVHSPPIDSVYSYYAPNVGFVYFYYVSNGVITEKVVLYSYRVN